MPNTYHAAPAVRQVAQPLIREHHKHLIVNKVYVKFLFCEEPEKVRGSEALGTARKISGLNAYLALKHDADAPRTEPYDGDSTDGLGKLLVSEFFLVTIYQDFWKSRSTTDHQRRALVDHELTHCWSEEQVDKDGNPTGKILLSLLPHDLEEFHLIAERYGAWRPDIATFAKALRDGQPSLFDDIEANEASDAGDGHRGASVTLTTRRGSVTLSSDKLREQAEKVDVERSRV